MRAMHMGSTSHCLRVFSQSLEARSGPATVLAVLAPAAARAVRPLRPQTQRLRRRPQRRDASTSAVHSSIQDDVSLPPPHNSTKSSDTASIAPPQERNNADAWAALLEPYLPLTLRTRILIEKSSEFDGVRCIDTLPRLLFRARTTSPMRLDLLSYLGVTQGRWKAVLWLTKTLLTHMKNVKTLPHCESILNLQSWRASGSLDELTATGVWVDQEASPFNRALPSLDSLTSSREYKTATIEARPLHDALGHIWQSIGSMVLEAADRSPEECKVIMSYVYQILAHLHHIGAIPNTIYNYRPAKDPSVLQRPPTLHLLSSRILTTLSDAVWRAQEKEIISEAASVGAEYSYKGHELPEARYKVRVRELGTEVWLELILWSCVQGGWISEAAWIVTEMEKRKGESKWSVINWDAIQEPPTSGIPKPSRVDWKGVMSRIGGAVGGIEGYNAAPPFVEMGPRTISSEVIAALIDGLVNLVRPVSEIHGKTPVLVWENINTCKKILERERFGLASNSWNSIILRLVESQAFNSEAEPAMLERILDFAPTYQQELEASNSPAASGSSAQAYVAEQSAASLGLLHRTLDAFACQGDLLGALRTLKRLQSLVDANRIKLIKEFKGQMEDRIRNGDEDNPASAGEYKSADVPGFHPQVPFSTLAVFLDLVTDARLVEVGKWLLYADDIDGRLIPSNYYRIKSLQPALLRFATATADLGLFSRVARDMKSPLPESHLRALLHCQIGLGKWDAVEDFFKYGKFWRNIEWGVTDVMVVARSYLRLERSDELESRVARTSAYSLLQDLLQGKYNLPHIPSQERNFSRERLLNQISRIFKTVPGGLAKLASMFPVDTGQAHATISIPVDAFNILLEGVVETYGSLAGRKLWHWWCRKPKTSKTQGSDDVNAPRKRVWVAGAGSEQVVTPNLKTLRLLLRPAVEVSEEARRAQSLASEDESPVRNSAIGEGSFSDIPSNRALFAWAYKTFGLTKDEILRGNISG